MHYADSQVAFDYPSTWQRYGYQDRSSFSAALVFLSSAPLHSPCLVNADGSINCSWPISRLPTNGVLVEWSADGFPLWNLEQAPGRPSTIGGRPSKIDTQSPGDCSQIGADMTIRAYVTRSVPDDWFEMHACLRGPDDETARSQVMRMLGTVHLSQA